MISKLLASTPLFSGLGSSALHQLAHASTLMRVQSGEALFLQGECGDALFLVVEGSLEVKIESASGARSILDTVVRGEWVGELSVVHGGIRAASVFALLEAQVIRVPSEICRQLIFTDPEAKRRFLLLVSQRQPSHHLQESALFAGLQREHLLELDVLAQWVRIKAGDTLCHAGDASDALFIVSHGSLEVFVTSKEGLRLVDVIGRGASLGEMGVLSGDPRSATVRALRDSELVRISGPEFHRLLDRHPSISKSLACTLSSRLRHTTQTPQMTRSVRTIAVVSIAQSPIPQELVPKFVEALTTLHGPILKVSQKCIDAQFGPGTAYAGFDDPASTRLGNWLNAQEAAFRIVVYECDPHMSPWTLRALRQADLVLLIAPAEQVPSRETLSPFLDLRQDTARQELVLFHQQGTSRPLSSDRWIKALNTPVHHHLRELNDGDYSRLARSVSGMAVGVVLSGGGARGFAHIGTLKALHDRGIPVDLIGGTSMGAIIAAQVALGWSIETMIAHNRKAFLECPVFADLTFPLIALMTGRSTSNMLQTMFGDARIEDLWLPYFCVSTNLSRAEVVIHEQGPVWLWTRASSAVPGIGPPVPYGGDLLVDGGVLNNLPADLMRLRCPGLVIASDASASVDLTTELETCSEISGWKQLWQRLNPWSTATPFPTLFEILMRTTAMSSDQSLDRTKLDTDLYLHPPLEAIDALDWGAVDRAVEIGYSHACEQIDSLRQRNPSALKPPHFKP